MTKISLYNIDENVKGNDKWIGSDAQNYNATKNFTPDNLGIYFNHNQVIDSGNALRYTYQTLDPLEQRRFGTLSFITEIGPQVNFSDITTFLLSKLTLKQNDVSEYLAFLNGSRVIISKASNTNLFGLYEITGVEVYLPEPNFFNITLTFVDGNGFIYEDNDYIISLIIDKYDKPPTKTSDLTNDGEDGIHPFITAQDIPPAASTLQDVVNNGNGISNYGGLGNADIQSTNFSNNRTLYLNNNSYPTIKLVDNGNSSHNLTIDLDTLNLNGTSYNWSSIVSGVPQNLQGVTDLGNTTTNDIVLNSTPGKYLNYTVQNTLEDLGLFGSMSSDIDENYSSYYAGYGFGINASLNTLSKFIGGYESTFQVYSEDTSNSNYNGGITLEATDGAGSSYIRLINKLGYEGFFKITNLTNNVTLQFPNKTTGTYTIATTADISTPTLQQVLDNNHSLTSGNNFQGTGAGGGALNATNVNAFGSSASSSNTSVRTNINAFGNLAAQNNSASQVNAFGYQAGRNNTFQNVNLFGYSASASADNQTVFSKWVSGTTSYLGRLSFTNITADRIWELPNASGTIALTSNIGNWGALNYPTWTTGTPFVKMTAAGTFALDTNIYLTSIISSDVTTALGYTPVTNARTLTINGVGYDLTADRSWTISTSSSPLTTKGDLYTFSTVDARLPVGLDTQVLIADSTASTGIKWGTNTAATPTGYYGAWQDNVTQTAAASNTGYAMIFRTIDLANGISVVTNGTNLTRITFANTGIYNLQFSSQFQNADNSQHDVNIWLRLNGTDVAGSNGLISVPARKSAGAGNEGHIIAGWNYVLSVVAGAYYELMWMTDNHTNVTMQYYAAGSPPPSAASVIMTVTQQSGIMAGTGITAINSLTGATQTLTVGTTGTDFAIVDSGTDHKFNLPTASATARGALSSANWTTFNAKPNLGLVQAMTVGLQNIF